MTTQMLSSRRKAGLPSGRNSLLNSVRSRSTSSSGLDRMNTSSVLSTRLARVKHEKLQKASGSLEEQLSLLGEKVDQGGKDVTSTAANVVSDFNDTMDYLKQISGVLNNYYRQSLKETVAGSQKELEEIGITVGMDGSLSLNKDKLASADEEKVKEVLGSSGDFVKRISAVASRVSDNARVNAENASSQYNSRGGLLNSYFSRYNFRG